MSLKHELSFEPFTCHIALNLARTWSLEAMFLLLQKCWTLLVESWWNVLFLESKHVIFESRCLFMLRNPWNMIWNPKTPWKSKKHQKLVKPDKLPFWHGHALRVEVEPTSGRSGPPWTFKMLSFSVPCVISSSIRPEPLLIRPEFKFYPKTNLKLEPNWIETKMDHSNKPN